MVDGTAYSVDFGIKRFNNSTAFSLYACLDISGAGRPLIPVSIEWELFDCNGESLLKKSLPHYRGEQYELLRLDKLPDSETLKLHVKVLGMDMCRHPLDEYKCDHQALGTRAWELLLSQDKPERLAIKCTDGKLELFGKSLLVENFPYFEAMFRNECVEKNTNVIQLSVTKAIFEAFWKFVGSGKLECKNGLNYLDLYEFGRLIGFAALQAAAGKLLLLDEKSKEEIWKLMQLFADSDHEIDELVTAELSSQLSQKLKRKRLQREEEDTESTDEDSD